MIAALVEQVSAAVVAADADDLEMLATAHTCFQRIAAEAANIADATVRGQVERPSLASEQLVERLILREVPDVAAGLRTLNETVCELQQLVRHGPSPTEGRPPEILDPAGPAPRASTGSDLPISADDVPLAREFITEADAHVEAVEAALLRLEEDAGDLEAIHPIFRGFHTIKGGAGLLNLGQIGSLAHAVEGLLDPVRKGKLAADGGIIDLVFEAVDVLKRMLAALDAAVDAGRANAREPELPDLLERLHAAGSSGSPAHPHGGAAPRLASDRPPDAAPIAEGRPDAVQGDRTVKVPMERLDSLINMVGELVISQAMVGQDVTALAPLAPRVLRNLSHLGKITRALQELSMSMRMVPVQGVFQKMARVVRDVGRREGKEIEFAVVGGETELDRNVVEAIADPLVHMVRNSVDHGIEPPQERLAGGKPRAGRLELRARHQSGQVVIEIADDGRGLDTDRILSKAIENGIVPPGEPPSEQDVFQLIFAAGLSTAERVTDISGRGVGMDVVRKSVEALRGRIDIRSARGQGTTFTLRLPLTLAVIDGMVVRVGGQRYIVPINAIEQSLRPTAEQLSTVHGRGELCRVRGRLLPLVRLHRLFGVTPRTECPTQAMAVVVNDGGDRAACLLVDELLGQHQVVIKSLADSLGGPVPGIAGAAILGDGGVSLILDVPAVIGLTRGPNSSREGVAP